GARVRWWDEDWASAGARKFRVAWLDSFDRSRAAAQVREPLQPRSLVGLEIAVVLQQRIRLGGPRRDRSLVAARQRDFREFLVVVAVRVAGFLGFGDEFALDFLRVVE